MNELKTRLLVLVSGVIACTWVMAGTLDHGTKKKNDSLKSEPIRILSDSLKVLQKQNAAIFSGNVSATQGQLRITCRKLIVSYSSDGATDSTGKILRMVFSGDVIITKGVRKGHCEQALYSKTESKLVCTGDPWVVDGQSKIHGTKIVYLLDRDEVRVTRPRAVLDVSEKEKQETN